jgi:hypothetical protein
MTQTVQGDSVDNFKGAPGIGAKKVEDYIQRYAGLEANIDNALRAFRDATKFKRYHKNWVHQDAVSGEHGVDRSGAIHDEFVMNARCARILRSGEYRLGMPHDAGLAPVPQVRLWYPGVAGGLAWGASQTGPLCVGPGSQEVTGWYREKTQRRE